MFRVMLGPDGEQGVVLNLYTGKAHLLDFEELQQLHDDAHDVLGKVDIPEAAHMPLDEFHGIENLGEEESDTGESEPSDETEQAAEALVDEIERQQAEEADGGYAGAETADAEKITKAEDGRPQIDATMQSITERPSIQTQTVGSVDEEADGDLFDDEGMITTRKPALSNVRDDFTVDDPKRDSQCASVFKSYPPLKALASDDAVGYVPGKFIRVEGQRNPSSILPTLLVTTNAGLTDRQKVKPQGVSKKQWGYKLTGAGMEYIAEVEEAGEVPDVDSWIEGDRQ